MGGHLTLEAECQCGPLLVTGQATAGHIFLWVTASFPPCPWQETPPLQAHPTTQPPQLTTSELSLLLLPSRLCIELLPMPGDLINSAGEEVSLAPILGMRS